MQRTHCVFGILTPLDVVLPALLSLVDPQWLFPNRNCPSDEERAEVHLLVCWEVLLRTVLKVENRENFIFLGLSAHIFSLLCIKGLDIFTSRNPWCHFYRPSAIIPSKSSFQFGFGNHDSIFTCDFVLMLYSIMWDGRWRGHSSFFVRFTDIVIYTVFVVSRRGWVYAFSEKLGWKYRLLFR